MSGELLASKVVIVEEEPSVRQITGVETNVLGMIGITERGPVGELTRCLSYEEWSKVFGTDIADGDASHAVKGFFDNGGQILDFVRTVHYSTITDPTTKTSVAASATIPTAGGSPTSGYVVGSVTGPYNLEPADTLIVATDGGGGTTCTFNATAAALECANAETYVLTNGMTLLLHVDGGAGQTVAFLTAEFANIALATAEEVAAVINAKTTGCRATVTSGGTKVTITSDTRGTGSEVHVTGGTSNSVLGFSTSTVPGTGNVVDIDTVSVSEIKTIVELAVTGVTVTNDGGKVRITRNTAGASYSVQVTAASTADDEIGFDNATHSGTSGAAQDTLTADGKYDGSYANDITVKIESATSTVAAEFNLKVLDGGIVVEIYPNLTMDSSEVRYAPTIVNDEQTGSKYIELTDEGALGTPAERRPASATHGPLSGGIDGLTSLGDLDFIGAVGTNGNTGLRIFDQSLDLALLAIPDRPTIATHAAMITYAEDTRSGSVFAILDPPASTSKADMVTYVESGSPALYGLTEYAAIYWPQIKVLNPNKNIFGADESIVVPPSGHIAGVFARTDASRTGGVYDQPAGIERGILRSVTGFEDDDVKQESCRDLIYPKRINPLTTGPGLPLFIDGSRTLKGTSNFPSIAERRGVNFIEQSVKRGIEWARHSDNTPELRARVERTVIAFLLQQYDQRAFRGDSPSTSFYVDVGPGLNPVSEQFAGKLNMKIGLATKKPAEYIVIRVSQDTREYDTLLAAASA
jgi:phage tail sheath protein FI